MKKIKVRNKELKDSSGAWVIDEINISDDFYALHRLFEDELDELRKEIRNNLSVLKR